MNRRAVVAWTLYDFANSAFAAVVFATIYAAYYALARSASAGMIRGGASDADLRSLGELTRRYNDIRRSLEAAREANEDAITSAFRTTRWIQRAGWLGSAVVIIGCIVLLGHLSRLVSASITRPVQEAARVAARLAEGDVTVQIADTDYEDVTLDVHLLGDVPPLVLLGGVELGGAA